VGQKAHGVGRREREKLGVEEDWSEPLESFVGNDIVEAIAKIRMRQRTGQRLHVELYDDESY
jgi:hypothetical protein